MHKLNLWVSLFSLLLLSGCGNSTITKKPASITNHIHARKTNNHAVKPSKITLKQRIIHEIFYAHYDTTDDLPKASNQVSQQVDTYLASITNLNEYHINITSITSSDVTNIGISQNYLYETTVYLVHK